MGPMRCEARQVNVIDVVMCNLCQAKYLLYKRGRMRGTRTSNLPSIYNPPTAHDWRSFDGSRKTL